MTMRQADKDLVQRYFDGELADDERARFEATMTADDRERLAALAEMRALLRDTLDHDAAEVDVWSGVQKQLATEQRKKTVNRRWRDRIASRFAATTSAGLLVAAMATLLLIFHPWRHNPENDCDVESLEVDGAVATVITMHDVPHHDTDTTTVIWAEED
jgi:anti-sigma factor RsiW